MIRTDSLKELDVYLKHIVQRTCENFPAVDPEDVLVTLRWGISSVLGPTLDPGDALLWSYARSKATEIAWKIRQEQLRLTEDYFYRPSDVSQILETTFDRCDWPAGYTPRDAREGEIDRMASLEVRMDACNAFLGLRPLHREALIKRYYDLEIPPRGSDDYKILRDAVTALTAGMNEYYRRD